MFSFLFGDDKSNLEYHRDCLPERCFQLRVSLLNTLNLLKTPIYKKNDVIKILISIIHNNNLKDDDINKSIINLNELNIHSHGNIIINQSINNIKFTKNLTKKLKKYYYSTINDDRLIIRFMETSKISLIKNYKINNIIPSTNNNNLNNYIIFQKIIEFKLDPKKKKILFTFNER